MKLQREGDFGIEKIAAPLPAGLADHGRQMIHAAVRFRRGSIAEAPHHIARRAATDPSGAADRYRIAGAIADCRTKQGQCEKPFRTTASIPERSNGSATWRYADLNALTIAPHCRRDCDRCGREHRPADDRDRCSANGRVSCARSQKRSSALPILRRELRRAIAQSGDENRSAATRRPDVRRKFDQPKMSEIVSQRELHASRIAGGKCLSVKRPEVGIRSRDSDIRMIQRVESFAAKFDRPMLGQDKSGDEAPRRPPHFPDPEECRGPRRRTCKARARRSPPEL